jgi:beta-galactosidase
VPYMLAEAVGQFSYGKAKNFLRRYRRAGVPEEQNSQALLHAQAHDRAAQDDRNAGVIAWCGFDYASPMNAYEGVKCPGVVDTFRIPKLGASFYMAQVDPNKRIVLEPSFYWNATLHATSDKAVIFSNCDDLHVFLNDMQFATLHPERQAYPKLAYPPFLLDLSWTDADHSILRIDGFVAGVQRVSRSFDGNREHDELWISADDSRIHADGIDSTRISFGVSDRFGNTRPTAEGVIKVQHAGAGTLIGDLQFPLSESGAVGAVWLRGLRDRSGQGTTTVIHPSLGQRSVMVKIV